MRTARYFQRVYAHGARIEFCVANHQGDPNQHVMHMAMDGTQRFWQKREEGDLLIFRSPDDWDGRTGLMWSYDRRLQRGEPMPTAEAERLAMGSRVSG